MERDDGQAMRRRRLVRGLGATVLAIGLVALGVTAGIWGERRASSGGSPKAGSVTGPAAPHGGMAMTASPPESASPAADPPAEVEVVLTADALARASASAVSTTS